MLAHFSVPTSVGLMNRLICERAGWRVGADTDYVRYGLISSANPNRRRSWTDIRRTEADYGLAPGKRTTRLAVAVSEFWRISRCCSISHPGGKNGAMSFQNSSTWSWL